jgi:hypothetical protein
MCAKSLHGVIITLPWFPSVVKNNYIFGIFILNSKNKAKSLLKFLGKVLSDHNAEHCLNQLKDRVT